MRDIVYFVPEAGGDAAIGALRCMKEALPNEKIVLVDALIDNASTGMWLDSNRLVVPIIENGVSKAFDMFMTNASKIFCGIILPTGEFFPQIFFDRKVRFDTSLLPEKHGWEISRNKWELSKAFDFVVNTSREWSEKTPFVKPIGGVGSRGCRLLFTKEEGNAYCERDEVVFVEYIQGNDYVVDVVHSHAWTRVVSKQRGGADVRVEFVEMKELEDKALFVARELGAPIANVQFRKRDNGKFVVIDVGTRLSGAACTALPLGCNPIALALCIDDFTRPIGMVLRRFEETLCFG